MTRIKNTMAVCQARVIFLPLLLVTMLGLIHSQAWAWGSATHAYIADRLGSTQGLTNLNEIYGAMALDTFNYLFDSPYQTLLVDQAHQEAIKVWNAAQTGDPYTRSAAYGFMSHNDVWGADYTAHHSGQTYGLGEGYIIAKAGDLLSSPYVDPLTYGDLFSFLGVDQSLAFDLTHVTVEIGVDVLMLRLDSQIGNKIFDAASQRTPQFPELLVQAYANDLNYEDAPTLIRNAEAEFDSLMQLYGLALSSDEATAVQLLSEQLANIADAYLEPYGTTLPPELDSFIEEYIYEAMALCQGDFEEEINQTIAFVDGQLRENSINSVPAPPSLILLGSGLFGMGLLGYRRRRG
ncbi:MAG: PEP-CTERM sorting domain-containing protein [Syntrophobacterales bacterium]|jgi:hypothetical protein